ncbi:hypothetical protein N7495_000880 [Penicillium taxi]|uniref:uncharacterized protein n=1 Tax=Penicillium taxi TaxID=168475 RepID=UPI002545A074|nr:uncharacterized protein N7495_000880 [Penicillium taxi]KAJ5908198.1 hypothetical protein N7495_000880 [Penicillium taxi]
MTVDFFSLIASPEFDCLDFHDCNQLSSQEQQDVSQRLYKPLRLLLEDVGYKQHTVPPDDKLRHDLDEWVNEHVRPILPGKDKVLARTMEYAVTFAEYCYPLCQHETKFVVAALTTVIISCDDSSTILDSDQRSSLSLVLFRSVARTSSQWLLERGLKTRSHNVMSAFVDACARETRMETELPLCNVDPKRLMHSHPKEEECSLEGFPAYLRSSSAAPLLYLIASFKISRQKEVDSNIYISSIPSISHFINYMNDLLSFPKEMADGETWNYIFLKTNASRQAGRQSMFESNSSKLWTVRDTFYELLESVRRATLGVDQAFTKCIPPDSNDMNLVQKDIRLAAQLWTAHKNGYIAWHLTSKRYRLDGLFEEMEN